MSHCLKSDVEFHCTGKCLRTELSRQKAHQEQIHHLMSCAPCMPHIKQKLVWASLWTQNGISAAWWWLMCSLLLDPFVILSVHDVKIHQFDGCTMSMSNPSAVTHFILVCLTTVFQWWMMTTSTTDEMFIITFGAHPQPSSLCFTHSGFVVVSMQSYERQKKWAQTSSATLNGRHQQSGKQQHFSRKQALKEKSQNVTWINLFPMASRMFQKHGKNVVLTCTKSAIQLLSSLFAKITLVCQFPNKNFSNGVDMLGVDHWANFHRWALQGVLLWLQVQNEIFLNRFWSWDVLVSLIEQNECKQTHEFVCSTISHLAFFKVASTHLDLDKMDDCSKMALITRPHELHDGCQLGQGWDAGTLSKMKNCGECAQTVSDAVFGNQLNAGCNPFPPFCKNTQTLLLSPEPFQDRAHNGSLTMRTSQIWNATWSKIWKFHAEAPHMVCTKSTVFAVSCCAATTVVSCGGWWWDAQLRCSNIMAWSSATVSWIACLGSARKSWVSSCIIIVTVLQNCKRRQHWSTSRLNHLKVHESSRAHFAHQQQEGRQSWNEKFLVFLQILQTNWHGKFPQMFVHSPTSHIWYLWSPGLLEESELQFKSTNKQFKHLHIDPLGCLYRQRQYLTS